jgi:hypothetical protein
LPPNPVAGAADGTVVVIEGEAAGVGLILGDCASAAPPAIINELAIAAAPIIIFCFMISPPLSLEFLSNIALCTKAYTDEVRIT